MFCPHNYSLDYDELYLRVRFDNGDGQGLRNLTPYQRITTTPRALVAEIAKSAKVADSVKPGGGDPTDDPILIHHHRSVERANLKIFEARNYPHPSGTRVDL